MIIFIKSSNDFRSTAFVLIRINANLAYLLSTSLVIPSLLQEFFLWNLESLPLGSFLYHTLRNNFDNFLEWSTSTTDSFLPLHLLSVHSLLYSRIKRKASLQKLIGLTKQGWLSTPPRMN